MSWESYKDIYVPGTGVTVNPHIAFVGEAPFIEEVEALTPFVGPTGRFLNSLLQEVGIERSECWVTNACKYFVPPPPKDKNIPFDTRAAQFGVNLQEQFYELQQELNQLKPVVVVAFGATALWALTGKKGKHNGITQWRGSIMSGMGFKCIPTYHPAHVLHSAGDGISGYWTKQVILFDLKRAKQQSEFKEIRRPSRTLTICKSAAQLYDFTNRNRNEDSPAIDIEARRCVPICIGIAFKKHEGITVPLWPDGYNHTISDSALAGIWIHLARFLSDRLVVGQNFGYDRDKIKRLGFRVAGLKSDTMFKAFCVNPELPKNLAFNTSIWTEEPYYKDEGMYDGTQEDLFLGCARDACVTKEIDDAMDPWIDKLGVRGYYENFLIPLHSVYHYRDDNTAIEQIGFNVNEDVRHALITKYIEWDEQVRYQLYKIAGDYINTSSPPQVSKLLYEKWKLPIRSGTGEEVLTGLINSPSVKNPLYKKGMELILEDRRVKKTISTYLYAIADFDKRMRTSYFLCLDTGRSATGQQEAPIRPTVEFKDPEDKKKKSQAMGAAFQVFTKHGDIGADVRTMYVVDEPNEYEAPEGYVFLQADSSQAEARVIFLLAEDYQALEDIDKHDYHALTASWFFGGTEDDYSKKKLGYESPIRFAGKTLRHAGHLGASKRRAAVEINTQARKYKIDYQISETEADRALKIFHAKQPKIKQVFQNGVIECLGKDRKLIAPLPFGIEGSNGGVRTFFERWGDELNRQAFSYLPQRTVSENTKAAALRIRGCERYAGRAEWIKIIVESHDALLTMVPIRRKQEAAIILKEELERPIDFSKCSLPRGQLIIPCEVEEGYNYKDFKKFRFINEVENV